MYKKIIILLCIGVFWVDGWAQDRPAELSGLESEMSNLTNRLQGLVDIHGFLSQGYFSSSDNNYFGSSEDGSFDYTEYGLAFHSRLSDQLTLGIQFFSREMGGYTTDGVQIDWAFADYGYREWLGVRVGRVNVPLLGMYNDTRDIDAARVPVILPQSMYQESRRDINFGINGIEPYGSIDWGDWGGLDYEMWLGGTKSDVSTSASKSLSEDGSVVYEKGETDYLAGVALSWGTPLQGLRFTGTCAEFNDLIFVGQTSNRFALGSGYDVEGEFETLGFYVGGMEYEQGPFLFATEYHIMRGDLHTTFHNTPLGTFSRDFLVEQEGYYFMATYQLTERVSFGSYYSVFYRDKEDRDGTKQVAQGRISKPFQQWQKDLAVSLRFDLTEHWIAKAELHAIDGAGQVASVDNPGGMEEDWFLYLFKLTYSF
ncbi:hypothetical protein BVY04_05425 [bacterium M21]|nr:hypothetical protein BVY04_05425 [bacterium M21]